jgi:hypothetical protein
LSPTYNAPMCDPTVTTGPVTTKTQVIATTEAPVEATTLPRACCKAMTKTCLACAAGITVETYCAKNPGKFGCTTGPVTTKAQVIATTEAPVVATT